MKVLRRFFRPFANPCINLLFWEFILIVGFAGSLALFGWRTSFEQLVALMVKTDMEKVAVERVSERVRTNLAAYQRTGKSGESVPPIPYGGKENSSVG